MNNVSLIARLCKDPELRHLPSGTEVCNLRVAVDRAGQKQDDGSPGAGFFDVDCFGKTAELAVQYLSKGRQVGIAGELRWREWETDAGKRQAVSIVANRITFIGSKDDNGGGGNQFVPSGAAASDFPTDDDIPF